MMSEQEGKLQSKENYSHVNKSVFQEFLLGYFDGISIVGFLFVYFTSAKSMLLCSFLARHWIHPWTGHLLTDG